MDAPTQPHSSQLFLRIHRLAVRISIAATIIAAAIIVALIAVIIWFVASALPTVSPAQEQIAQIALTNPTAAPLYLGRDGDARNSLWSAASSNDYAILDNQLVVLPNIDEGTAYGYLDMSRSAMVYSVLVYASGGQDLSLRPAPTETNFYDKNNRWYMFDCGPVLGHNSWWACTLLIGTIW